MDCLKFFCFFRGSHASTCINISWFIYPRGSHPLLGRTQTWTPTPMLACWEPWGNRRETKTSPGDEKNADHFWFSNLKEYTPQNEHKLIFQPQCFRCYVSFREGIPTKICDLVTHFQLYHHLLLFRKETLFKVCNRFFSTTNGRPTLSSTKHSGGFGAFWKCIRIACRSSLVYNDCKTLRPKRQLLWEAKLWQNTLKPLLIKSRDLRLAIFKLLSELKSWNPIHLSRCIHPFSSCFFPPDSRVDHERW